MHIPDVPMLYVAPTGSTDPNAPYIGKNVAAGQQGSKIPPKAVENPQREIVAVITASGETPTGTDTTQLVQAIRGGTLSYFRDSGIVNALAITPSPIFLALTEGNTFRVKAAFAPTSASTLAVNNLAAVPIRKSGGNALTGGEWQAGDIVQFAYDGFYFQFLGAQGASSLVATSNVVLNVPSQYSSIRAALLAASLLIISPAVTVTIQVAPNYVEYITAANGGPWQISLPFGQQISIVGPPLSGAYPSYVEMTGLSNANQLTLLKSRYNARVECVGCGALEVYFGGLNIKNLLFVGDGTASGGFYGWKVGSWSTKVGFGFLGAQNCWVHNFGLDNIRAEQSSVIQGNNLGSTSATAHNFHISHYSVLECNVGNICAMNGQTGVMLQNYGMFAIDSASGTIDISNNQDGVASPSMGEFMGTPSTGLRIKGNTRYGFNMSLFSSVGLSQTGNTTFAGNGSGDINAGLNSIVATFGCALPGGSSPSRGTTGNTNSQVI